jgi:hypothetical protein
MAFRLAVAILAGIVFFAAPAANADQVSISYVDANSQAQTLTVDASSAAVDLELAASLINGMGVAVVHDSSIGIGSLADIAAAMAAAAPVFAADIAQVLSALSPTDRAAIVAAVNAISGVNTTAVLAAVHFGTSAGDMPPVDRSAMPDVEQKSSDN